MCVVCDVYVCLVCMGVGMSVCSECVCVFGVYGVWVYVCVECMVCVLYVCV